MSTKAQWSGTLARIGIGVSGPTAGPIRIERITLEPASPWNLAVSTWQEWTAFEGQQGYSMNFIVGGAQGVTPLLRPIPALAALLGLSLVLFLISRRRWPNRRDLTGGVTVFIIVWMIADLRWAVDLAQQNRVTVERYGGKTLSEKRVAAEDPELYRFAQALVDHLPEQPQPVFVLTEDPLGADRYLRLRLAFHLLPHNVYAYWPYPPPPEDTVRPSYAVVTTPNKWTGYDERAGVLRWVARYRPGEAPKESDLKELPATQLYQDSIGSLYRID